MATKPRKPWRVIVIGPDVRAQSDHTSEAKAYQMLRAALSAGTPADTARVEQWEGGRWRHFETVTADEIRAAQLAADDFVDHMASQDPARLEADRAAAWRTTEK